MRLRKIGLLTFIIVLSIIPITCTNEWDHKTTQPVFLPLPPPPPAARKSIVDSEAYLRALQFFYAHQSQFSNRRYITIIDYTKPSTNMRMYVIDLESGAEQRFLVSHGKNSGWLYATSFSNRPESRKSSRGFFLTGEKYCGEHGPSMEMYGLEKGVNDNAYSRRIVMHGADYVHPRAIVINRGRLGRSFGCPAVPTEYAEGIIDKIKGGGLLAKLGNRFGSSSFFSKRPRRPTNR